MQATLRFISIAVILAAAGCAHSTSATLPEQSSASRAFQQGIRDRGVATFRSWNGKAYRMDSDTELAFHPDGSVEMLEWGLSLLYYAGRYHVHPDGYVSAWFKDYRQEWPTMEILDDAGSLGLQPANRDNVFMMGSRGGATGPPTKDTFWPFRQLAGRDEQEVLENMARKRKEALAP